MSGSKCARLSGALVRDVLDSVDCVLFDCDGVIWRGEQAVPGAPQVVNLLKEKGKRVFFVTNNSTKTRKMYAEKMSALGLRAAEDEVFSTAFCCAAYLRAVCRLEGGKVYLVGSEAMARELEAVGIRQTGVGPDHVSGRPSDWANVPLDPDVKAVVVGFDEHFSFMKVNRAMQYLARPGCLFVGTNRDSRLPLEGGKAVPGRDARWQVSGRTGDSTGVTNRVKGDLTKKGLSDPPPLPPLQVPVACWTPWRWRRSARPRRWANPTASCSTAWPPSSAWTPAAA